MKSRLTLLALIIVLIGTCYAGRVEFNDEVISGMSEDTYEMVRIHANGNTRSDIVSEYLNNRNYYDSIQEK